MNWDWEEKIQGDLRQMPGWHARIVVLAFLIFLFSLTDWIRGMMQIGSGPIFLPVFNIILMAVCLFFITLPFVMVEQKKKRASKG